MTNAQRRVLRQFLKHGCVWPSSPDKTTWLEEITGVSWQLERGPVRGGEGSSSYPMGNEAIARQKATEALEAAK